MELLELPQMAADDKKELEIYGTQALSVMDEAVALVATIHSPATAEVAAVWCAGKLGWCDRIKNSYLGRVKEYFHKGHKDAIAEIEKYTVPVEGNPSKRGDDGGAVGIVKRGIAAWREVERQRIAFEQAKANAAAKKKAEEDALANAIKAEAAGHKPIADAILAQANNYVPPVIPVVKSKVHSGRMVWKITLDPMKKGELLKMIAERPDLHAFVVVDQGMVQRQAALMDGNLNWPGVTCYQEEQLSIRKSGY